MNLLILPDSAKARPPILNDSSRGSFLERANRILRSFLPDHGLFRSYPSTVWEGR